jgi:hypothetical protein
MENEMSELMDCEDCGGAFLEDYGSCTCDKDEIIRLKKELKDMRKMFFAYIGGDEEDLPKRLQKKLDEMTKGM